MLKGMEIGGIALGISGWILSIIACALPMWCGTVFVNSQIITARSIWQGLWMNCAVQSTRQIKCKVYNSIQALPQEIQVSRAMTVIVVVLAFLGVMIYIIGTKCTNFIKEEVSKAKMMIVSGVMFIIAGILELIPVVWVAHLTIQEIYNQIPDSVHQREVGASIYVGFAAVALLLIGGALLCCTCPPQEKKYKTPRMGYSVPRFVGGGYDRMDHV
ncbi:claudin-3-like [Onychostoma macrolepis]|uniref:claudin-3-like n=1 Tax=Onychostoma macrolepis TaxID=369639 RepID=UPI00272D3CF7|nr:claudin-3-like [Onychostoma macrolepis]